MTSTLKPGQLGGLKTRKASEVKSKPSIMLYGGSGIGKSTLAASACLVPELSPVLHLNIENGIGEGISEQFPDIDVLDVESIGELQNAYEYLAKTADPESGTVGSEGWRTVILDNLTEAQKQGMAHLHNESPKTFKFDDVLTGTWADGTWNKNSEQMRKLIRAFRGLPVYTIFIAWERDLSKPDSALTDLVPSFSPSFAKEAPGMLNDIYYYHFDKQGQRVLETSRSKNWTAKDRTGKMPAQIVNPTMSVIHDYWTGRKTAPTVSESAKRPGISLRK
ncbi:MAG TPA: AAA family ATPase [Verrucomicrobiae bacterium]|nr:AAA family ATPase [Verrucomicrobiae bacterium]